MTQVQVQDIEPSVFKEMLRYLYTERASELDEGEMTEPLFLAARNMKSKDWWTIASRAWSENWV